MNLLQIILLRPGEDETLAEGLLWALVEPGLAGMSPFVDDRLTFHPPVPEDSFSTPGG